MKLARPIFFSLFFSAIIALYAFHLNFPATEYYDEVYHVKTGREFIQLSGNTDTVHPPFGKVLIAASIRTFGDKSWAWRLPSLVFGLAALFMFFLLARKFFQDDYWALCATLLLALDGIFFTQARIAMLNATMLFFMLLSLWLFIKALETSFSKPGYLFAMSISLGLAFGTRWISYGILPIMGVLFLKNFKRLENKKDFFLSLPFLFLIIVVVYILCHLILIPINGYGWKSLWQYQVNMLSYHVHLKATHNYGSEWWSWPIMSRPIWYYFDRINDQVYGVFCIGNPAVMWAFFPALGYLIWHYLKTKSQAVVFVIFGFLSQWLPWAFIGRVKFFHYHYPAMPFVALAITFYLRELWQTGKWGKVTVCFYLAFVIAMFAYWYPLLSGYPISEQYFQNHLWFKSWI